MIQKCRGLLRLLLDRLTRGGRRISWWVKRKSGV